MKVGILKETSLNERRVAAVPETISKMAKAGTEVFVESGAGKKSFIEDNEVEAAGARVAINARALLSEAEIVLKVNRPSMEEVNGMKEGTIFVGFLNPFSSADILKKMTERKITSFAME